VQFSHDTPPGETYRTARYGSNARWLLKALREAPGEIAQVTDEFHDYALRWRPAAGELSAIDVLAFLLESEREDLRAARALIRRDGAPIEERRAHLAVLEQDLTQAHARNLLWDYLGLREELLWLLEDLGPEWEHAGVHPYRGRVTLTTLIHEVNERDLEALWTLHRRLEAAPDGWTRPSI